MTTFNLSMGLYQSPFYPKDRERDLLQLMEFKDCSMSDEESWEVRHQVWTEEGYVHSNARSCVSCKGVFLLHHSSAAATDFFAVGLTFNRLTGHGSGNGAPKWGGGTDSIRTDSYLWEMTVCKYLNLWKGTRGDNEECHEIGGVSSQHLFHQAFFQWGAIAWQHEVIGECVITPTDPFCINMCF